MRRVLGVASLVLGTTVLVLGFAITPAHGEAPDQSGWWFELKTKAVPVAPPAPPNVPADGLYVQQGPEGTEAFSALRYVLPEGASATLTLTAAQGSTTTLGAPLQACATTTTWTPPLPAPGYWEDRPSYAKTCTPGTVSTDGKYVAFLLAPPILVDGVIDVAIVPTDGAAPFAIAFDNPGPDGLVVKQGAPSFSEPPPAAYEPPASDSTATLDAPPFTVVPSAPAAVTTSTTVAAPAVQQSPVASLLQSAGVDDPDRAERMAALGGSSAIVVGWWLLSSRRSRVPRLVGALAGGGVIADAPVVSLGRVGGVGRFARARERNARALR